MDIDFTALNSLATRAVKRNTAESEAGDISEHGTTPEAVTAHSTASQGHAEDRAYYGAGQLQKELEQARKVYATHQENTKRSELLRADILKGLKHGEKPAVLLLKALECISLMTGNTVFYAQGKKALELETEPGNTEA